MRHVFSTTLALLVLLAALAASTACRPDATVPLNTEPAAVMIAPGQTTVALDAFTLRAPPATGYGSGCGSSEADSHPCPPTVLDVCDQVRNAASLAVLEIVEQTDHVLFNADPCAEPYGNNDAYIARTRVLAVAAGEELPADLRVVFFNYDWPLRQDGLLLVRLAHLGGEWFGIAAATIMREGDQLSPEAAPSDDKIVYDLPDNFADLATQAMDAMEHYDQRCPANEPNATEEEFTRSFRYPECGWPITPTPADDAGTEADAN